MQQQQGAAERHPLAPPHSPAARLRALRPRRLDGCKELAPGGGAHDGALAGSQGRAAGRFHSSSLPSAFEAMLTANALPMQQLL